MKMITSMSIIVISLIVFVRRRRSSSSSSSSSRGTSSSSSSSSSRGGGGGGGGAGAICGYDPTCSQAKVQCSIDLQFQRNLQAEAFRTLSMKARGPPGYEASLRLMRFVGLGV